MSSDYRAKEDGRLYANEWYTDEWEVFIITERMGKAYSGLHETDGNSIVFPNIVEDIKTKVLP